MITPNTTAAHEPPQERDPISDRHVLCNVTDPTGQTRKECLLTVLNRLSAIGHDRWETRQSLNAGVAISANGWRFVVVPEHQHRPWKASPNYATQPNPDQLRVDDVKQAYDALVMMLERPKQRGQLDVLLANIVSRIKNHAQVQSLRAACWAEEALDTEDAGDAERSGLFEGHCAALAWVGDELVALMGRQIKARHLAIRPFDFPEAWRVDVPTDEDLQPLTPEESRAEQRASDAFDRAKEERYEHQREAQRAQNGGGL